MTEPNSSLPCVLLIPARDLSLDLRQGTRRHVDPADAELLRESPQFFLELEEPGRPVSFEIPFLSEEEVRELAGGEELEAPRGEARDKGVLRLAWLEVAEEIRGVVLECVPDKLLPRRLAFDAWLARRFPVVPQDLRGLRHEAEMVFFHNLWREETVHAGSLAPDDALLCAAVVNNHEVLVEEILTWQPRICMRSGSRKTLHETALGIALENAGKFGPGAGQICGCHRDFREERFDDAESWETWIPRAERIAARLIAAGAVDNTPLFEACRSRGPERLRALLEDGFPPNFSIYGHTTALCEALAGCAAAENVPILLQYGADPNLPREFHTSMAHGGLIFPLTLALRDPQVCAALLAAGADPALRCDDHAETPVIFAAQFRSAKAAEKIFAEVDFPEVRGPHQRSGVFFLDAISLRACRDVFPAALYDEPDDCGTTPLLHAIACADWEKAKWLIDMGADVCKPGIIMARDENNDLACLDFPPATTQLLTPLQAALQRRNFPLAERMKKLGADAGRFTLKVSVPAIGTRAEFLALYDRLAAELPGYTGENRDGAAGSLWPLQQKRAAICEEMLCAALVRDARVAERFPELVQPLDLLETTIQARAAKQEMNDAEKNLGPIGWIICFHDAIGRLTEKVDEHAREIEDSGITVGPYPGLVVKKLLDTEHVRKCAIEKIIGRYTKAPRLVNSLTFEGASENTFDRVRFVREMRKIVATLERDLEELKQQV